MRRGWDEYALAAAANGRAGRLMDLRRLLCGHPLDNPKLPEREGRTAGKRSNAPLLWLHADGSRR